MRPSNIRVSRCKLSVGRAQYRNSRSLPSRSCPGTCTPAFTLNPAVSAVRGSLCLRPKRRSSRSCVGPGCLDDRAQPYLPMLPPSAATTSGVEPSRLVSTTTTGSVRLSRSRTARSHWRDYMDSLAAWNALNARGQVATSYAFSVSNGLGRTDGLDQRVPALWRESEREPALAPCANGRGVRS